MKSYIRPRRRVLTRVVVSVAVIGLAGAVSAQPAPSQDALNWMRLRLSGNIQRPPYLWTREQVASLVEPLFLLASQDETRITRDQREQATKSARAQKRVYEMTRFLAADVEGRGRIDRQDLLTSLARRAQAVLPLTTSRALGNETEDVEAYFHEVDADRDGFVSYREAVEASDAKTAAHVSYGIEGTIPEDLDVDGDGVVTIEEFRAVLRTVYDEIDTDHDGRLSQAEVERFQTETIPRAHREAQARSQRAAAEIDARTRATQCAIPAWDPQTILAAVIARGQSNAADIVIGAGDDSLGVVDVYIEPGAERISVVLNAAQPVLWQFTGAIDRIARAFVAQDESDTMRQARDSAERAGPVPRRTDKRPGSGVVGLAPDRVRFASRQGCLPTGSGPYSEHLKLQLAAALGHEPNVVVGPAAMATAHLPSGTDFHTHVFSNAIDIPTGGPGGPLWAMLARSGRSLIHVEPAAVIAALPVRSGPLPGLAGLAALVADGRAEVVAWNTVTRFILPDGDVGLTIVDQPGEPRITKEPSQLRVLAPVTLPPGLNGAGIDRLIVARGVVTPSGALDSICVVREEDDKPVDGSRCD